jgi:tetratricopeptide (TPR) repeat protein
VIVAVILILIAALSVLYSRMWRDPVQLWSASAEYHPQCGRSHFNLGTAYWKAGDPSGAFRAYRAATEYLPDDERRSWAWAHLGTILAQAGENERAIAACRASLELRPQRVNVRRSLALLLSEEGRHAEALAELEIAIGDAPDAGILHLDLARECLAVDPPQPLRARQAYYRALELGATPDESLEENLSGAGGNPPDEEGEPPSP